MHSTIDITCDICREVYHYEDCSPKQADYKFRRKGGEIDGQNHVCGVCVERKKHDFFSIDIGKKDPQVLAVLYDPNCMKHTRIMTPVGARKKDNWELALRRITESEYGTLEAFGIPSVEIETLSLSKGWDTRVMVDYESGLGYQTISLQSKYASSLSNCFVLDLRAVLEQFWKEQIPHKSVK